MTMPSRCACAIVLSLGVAAVFGCSNVEADKRKYVESGDRFVAEKKDREAIVEYRNAIRADAQFGEARLKLAEAYERIGDGTNAYREYIRASDLLPDRVDVHVKAATFLALAGEFEDAKTRVTRALDRDPRNVEAQIVLGNALAGLRDLDGAVSQIEEAIQIDPARGLSYTNLGVLKLQQGEKEAARAAFEKAVETDSRSVPARLALAMFELQIGEAAAAEESLKTALTLDPRHVQVNRLLAALYMASNRAAEAEAPLKTIVDVTKSSFGIFALADYYRAMGRVDDARATITPLLDQEATFPAAQLRLAQLDYATGNRPAAHTALDALLKRHATDAPALTTKARWLLSEGHSADALSSAQAAVKAAPQSTTPHYVLGMVQASLRDVTGAIASFQEVVKLNPSVAAAQVQLSRLQLVKGATSEAVQLAESAVRNAPQSGEARLTLARGLVMQRELSRAEPIIAVLEKEFPKVAGVHAVRGMFHLVKNEFPLAHAAYARAARINPADLSAVTGLTTLDLLEKKVDAARSRVEARLAVTPDDPALLLLASRVFLAANDPARAERTLRRIIQLTPADSTAYAMLGQMYVAQNRMDEAQAEFDGIAKRNPKDTGARTLAAMIAHGKNQMEDAKKRYRDILDVDDKAAVAANNLAWIYAEEGEDLDEALRLARKAAQNAPDRAEIQDTLGWVYYRKDLPSLAIPPFEESVRKDPGNATYHYHLGMAYAKSGDAEQARRAIASALKLKPDYREARELEASLRHN